MSTQAAAIPGTVVPASAQVSPGGPQGISGAANVSTDPGNIATIGSDGLISVPQSQIWSMRLHSFSAVGNPTFEVDQRSAGTAIAVTGGTIPIDRWSVNKTGTLAATAGQTAPIVTIVPGTSFWISRLGLKVTITTAQATLAAGDNLQIYQAVEGSQFRELANDVHSVSILAQSSVANLKFSMYLQDSTSSRSLVKLCSLGAANTPTLFSFPNIPVWPAAGTFPTAPGGIGYYFGISLAAGSTFIAPAADTWQTGAYIAASGMSNFAATNGATFTLQFVQHEPGPVCTTLMDLDFNTNLSRCQRYFAKTHPYGVVPGAATNLGIRTLTVFAGGTTGIGPVQFKRTMAKAPTMTAYNYNSGVANSIRDSGAVDHAVTSFGNIGDDGFSVINFTTGVSAAGCIYALWTADTGW